MRGLMPIWGDQAVWDVRQYPNLQRIWAELWEHLCVSLASCRFTLGEPVLGSDHHRGFSALITTNAA
jgi:hypothetical protein